MTLFCFAPTTSWAQRLSIPKAEASVGKKVEMTGVVSQIGKYSFSMQTGTGQQKQELKIDVSLSPRFTLQLHEPMVDLEKGKLWVTRFREKPKTEKAQTKQKPNEIAKDSKDQPRRVAFDLPKELFVRMAFNHQRHMQRVMEGDLIRLNGYTLMGQDPGNNWPEKAAPTILAKGQGTKPKSAPLILSGRLEIGAKPDQPKLISGENKADVFLGFHRGELEGRTILDLVPNETQVTVSGSLVGDKLIAKSIKFLPLAVEKPSDQ